MKRSITGVMLGVVLVMGSLTGCGGDDAKPTSSPTKSVPVLSASPSPSVGQQPTGPIDVDPPERPAAMDNADEAGAVAAAEYFLRLTVYASATGDTTELEAMSGDECKSCQKYISSVKSLYERGGWWTSMPEISLSESQQWIHSEEPLQYQVEFEAKKDEYEYYNAEGELKHTDKEHAVFAVILMFDDSWTISAVRSVSPEEAAQASSTEQ